MNFKIGVILFITIPCLIGIMAGCDPYNEHIQMKNPDGASIDAAGDWVDVVLIDRCEYLKFRGSITHKGNCRNPMHTYNKK